MIGATSELERVVEVQLAIFLAMFLLSFRLARRKRRDGHLLRHSTLSHSLRLPRPLEATGCDSADSLADRHNKAAFARPTLQTT